jgi:hypothetical protein
VGLDDGDITCHLIDISAAGACLSGHISVSVEKDLFLTSDHFSPIRATVAWRSIDRVGLRFREQQAWVNDKWSERFDAAAWLNKPAAPFVTN